MTVELGGFGVGGILCNLPNGGLVEVRTVAGYRGAVPRQAILSYIKLWRLGVFNRF